MLYWAQSAQAAQQVHIEWWWFLPPGLAVGLFGTALALLNFGIDEFINPRLRAAGLTRRRARQAGLPRRVQLGLTPVMRQTKPERRCGMIRVGEPLLEVSGLCVDYGFGADAVHAVTGADLTLHRGEVFGLAGESGSGKSTLAYAIARLLRMPGVITGGEVIFRHDGQHDQPAER